MRKINIDISELEYDKEKAEAKLEQAQKELEKAYENNSKNDIFQRAGDGLTGAGLAALLILIAQGLGGE